MSKAKKKGTFDMIGLDDLGSLEALDITKADPAPAPVKYRSTSTKLRDETWRAMKQLAIAQDRHMHDLFQEAAELLLKKHEV